MPISAYGGKPIGYTGSVDDIENEAQYAMWKGSRGKVTASDTEKALSSWLKDAYVFAKNNEKYLDNPEVQAILQEKLSKLERAGVFTPAYKEKGVSPSMRGEMQMPSGQTAPYSVAGPGAGSGGQMTTDYASTIQALYQRFMMDKPGVYKPEQISTVDQQGRPTTEYYDPIQGRGASQLFQKPPIQQAPGTELIQPKAGGADVLHRTKTESEISPSKWEIIPQPDGSYWIQDKSGRGKPTIVAPFTDKEDVADKDYRWALQNAAVDLDNAQKKGGAMARKEGWWRFDEKDEAWEARKQKFLEERINFWLGQLGYESRKKKAGTGQSPKTLTPEQQKADSILFNKKGT